MKRIIFLLVVIILGCQGATKEAANQNKPDHINAVTSINIEGTWMVAERQSFFIAAEFNNSSLILDTRGDTILRYKYYLSNWTLTFYNIDSVLMAHERLTDYTDSSFMLESLMAEHYPHHFYRAIVSR